MEEFEEILSRVSCRPPFLEARSVSQLPTKPTSESSSHNIPNCNTQVQNSKSTKSHSSSPTSTFNCYNCQKLGHVAAKCLSAKSTLMIDMFDDVIDE